MGRDASIGGILPAWLGRGGALTGPNVNLRNLAWIGIAVLALWRAWGQWSLRPIEPGDGELAPDDPVQTSLEDPPDIVIDRWTLTPRAAYDITARVLSREDYRFDPIASLIPMDLTLGWGAMSDSQVLSAFEISQDARFYSWRPVAASTPASSAEFLSASSSVSSSSAAIRDTSTDPTLLRRPVARSATSASRTARRATASTTSCRPRTRARR